MYKAAPAHIKRVIILGYHFEMRVGASEMPELRGECRPVFGSYPRA